MKMQSDKEGENMMDEKGGIIFVYKLFPNSSFISHLEAAYPSHLWWSWWCRTLSCPLPPGELFVFGVLTSPDTHSLDLFLRWLTLRYCQSAKCKKRDGERERKRRRKRWRIGEIVVEVVMLIGWRTKKGNLRITSVLILWLSKVFSPSIFFFLPTIPLDDFHAPYSYSPPANITTDLTFHLLIGSLFLSPSLSFSLSSLKALSYRFKPPHFPIAEYSCIVLSFWIVHDMNGRARWWLG